MGGQARAIQPSTRLHHHHTPPPTPPARAHLRMSLLLVTRALMVHRLLYELRALMGMMWVGASLRATAGVGRWAAA